MRPISFKILLERSLFTLTLSLTLFLAWQFCHIESPLRFEFSSNWQLVTNWILYRDSIRELLRFQGGYVQDIWGIMVFVSMVNLILVIGRTSVKKIFDNDKNSRTELLFEITISWAIGSAVLGLFWLLLSSLGLIYREIAYLIFGAGLFLGIANFKGWVKDLHIKLSSIEDFEPLEKIILAFLSFWLLIWMINAFYPESWEDALVYHLGLPSYYIANQDFQPTPHNIFSYLNQHMEMIYLWALLTNSEVAVKLVNWTFLLMTALLLFKATQKYSNRFCGLVAVLFLLMMPMVIIQVMVVGNDLQAAYYCLAGWVFGIMALDQPQESVKSNDSGKTARRVSGSMFLSGCCFGTAFGTKYSALAVIFASVLGLIYLLRLNHHSRSLMKLAGIFSLGLFIFAGPWIWRNIKYTGNPVYPFFQAVFSRPYVKEWHNSYSVVGQTTGEKERTTGALTNYQDYFRELIGSVSGTPHYQAGWILALFILILISFLHKENTVAQVTCIVSAVSWLVTSGIVLTPRYALTNLVLLCFPLGVSIRNSSSNIVIRYLLFFVVLSNIFFHGTISNLIYGGVNAFSIAVIGATPERFKFQPLTSGSSRIDELVAINRFLRKDIVSAGRVLMIGLVRPYRFETPFHYSSPNDRQYIDDSLDFCTSARDLRNSLISAGFGYVLFDKLGWNEYKNSKFNKLSSKKNEILKEFMNRLTLLQQTENLTLYAIIL